MTENRDKKERKYKILETIMLDFATHQDQYSALYEPEDNAQVIVHGSNVYLLYEGRKQLTINGTDLIDLYVKRGALVEEKD